VWSYYRDALSAFFNVEELDGKTIGKALWKDKLIKSNLSN
jgi:hypothetical protein